MGRMPSFQFYTADWKADTELAKCSLAARGFWTEVIVAMRISACPTMTETAETFGQLCRCTAKAAREALRELLNTKTADGKENPDGTFTITCRRMAKDLKELERWRESKRNGKGGKPPASFPEDSRDSPGDFPPDSRDSPATFPALSRPSSASSSGIKTPKAPAGGGGGFDVKPFVGTPVFKSLKAAKVNAIPDLLRRGVTVEMVEEHRGKTGPAMYSALIVTLAEREEAKQKAETLAGFESSLSPHKLCEIEHEARSRYPPGTPYHTGEKDIHETDAYTQVLAEHANGALK